MESLKGPWNETKGLFTLRWGTPGRRGNMWRVTYHVNVIKLKWEIIWTGGLPNRVTSPVWSPPPPCKKAVIVLKMKRVRAKNSSEGEGYTSETWRSTLEYNGLLAESQRQVTQTDAIAITPPKSGAFLVAFSLHRTSLQGNLVSLKVY